MAAVIAEQPGRRGPRPGRPGQRRRRSWPVWRWAILVIVGAYFVIPLYAALRFTGISIRFRPVLQPGWASRPRSSCR